MELVRKIVNTLIEEALLTEEQRSLAEELIAAVVVNEVSASLREEEALEEPYILLDQVEVESAGFILDQLLNEQSDTSQEGAEFSDLAEAFTSALSQLADLLGE